MFMNPTLPREQLKRFFRSPMPELEHDLFQFRVLLPVDTVQIGGLHAGFLKLLKETARFDALVLADFARVRIVVADQEHMITRPECVEKSAHLFG